MRVGVIPYAPGFNPYQSLAAAAVRAAGIEVTPIPGSRFFPISRALRRGIDLLWMDWPHSFYTGRNTLATAAKRAMYSIGLWQLERFPFVWTMHNLAAHDATDPVDEQRMIQRLIRRCDGIIVMSNAAAELLRSTYIVQPRTLIEVIPHGHYIDSYSNQISVSAARERLEIPADAKVVLAIGRICAYKGLEDLIGAFGRVGRRGDVLLIAGRPEDSTIADKLMALAADVDVEVRVQPQIVPDDDLQLYFNAGDVVALPFRNVLNSGTLMLAMSFGRCVVAPRLGSIEEIAHEEAFFGYDPCNPQGLERALETALAETDLLDRGLRSRDAARRSYSWDDIGKRTRNLFTAVVDSANG